MKLDGGSIVLQAVWKNTLYILEHKLNVLIECWKEGLFLQGIIHDWSKFSPQEFLPYAKKFFYKGQKDSTDELKWKYAWLHHQHKNKHHWEHWVVDPKNKQALPMPRKYLLEMVCDWRSFSRRWGRRVKASAMDLSGNIILHPDTKKELEVILMKKTAEDAKRKNRDVI
ncbi:DUF5662 family protein [Bacillus infantis]|uniref:DUF5662 family protein n=1 Tax=Bacillus infantis TaxID=324767 RepID=UPI001CD6D27E|nr:DUF5662 family protein [Bacillus infantis]MCA1040044.1 DUF5662 family protein [Bacillus infantis]